MPILTPEAISAYTNALLVAILPHITEFVQKQELDVPTPVTVSQVARLRPNRMYVGATIELTNGMRFDFEDGYVRYYKSEPPGDEYLVRFFTGREPARERPRIERPEALERARAAITRLGIPLERLYADLEPRTEVEPQKIRGRWISRWVFKWVDPRYENIRCIALEIDAHTGRLQSLDFSGDRELKGPSLDVAVPPGFVVDPLDFKPLDEAERAAMLRAALPGIEWWIRRLGLPVATPLARGDVAWRSARHQPNGATGVLALTNGMEFVCTPTAVLGYSTRAAFFLGDQRPVREFEGRWKVGQAEAVALARKAVKRLIPRARVGARPTVRKPTILGRARVPRYEVDWARVLGPKDTPGGVLVEVDAERGEVVGLGVNRRFAERELAVEPLAGPEAGAR